MSASYWVLASDELMRLEPQWPDGLRLAVPAAIQYHPGSPSMRWYRFDDDDAPAELEGKRVELTFRTEAGQPVLARREIVP